MKKKVRYFIFDMMCIYIQIFYWKLPFKCDSNKTNDSADFICVLFIFLNFCGI